MENNQISTTHSDKRFKRLAIGTVIAVALLVGTNVYLYSQLTDVRDHVAVLTESFTQEVNTVRESSALDTGKARQEVEGLREQLSATIQQAETSVGRAKAEAKKHAEKLAGELARKTEAQGKQIAERISEIADDTSTKIEQVNNNVDNVKVEVASNRQELDGVVSEFKQVHGDLGVMSGRIATNADELNVLRKLGEREYFEFDIPKSKVPTRVGEVQLALRNTAHKDNRFAVDIYADDKRIEKKYKTVNEPIQFYIGGRGGQPYEVVVNQVKKDRIVGYLSTPKVEMARR